MLIFLAIWYTPWAVASLLSLLQNTLESSLKQSIKLASGLKFMSCAYSWDVIRKKVSIAYLGKINPSNSIHCCFSSLRAGGFLATIYRGLQVLLCVALSALNRKNISLLVQYNMLLLVTVSVPSWSVLKPQLIPKSRKLYKITNQQNECESPSTKNWFAQGSFSGVYILHFIPIFIFIKSCHF